MSEAIEIPRRALFKAAEVCEIAGVQPYVLKSWESEFPNLGIAKSPGAPRLYRRSDVERVLRIRHLVYAEGLTLSGARRRIEDEEVPVAADEPIEKLFGRHARERLTEIKKGLRSLLELLSSDVRPSNGRERRAGGAVVSPMRTERARKASVAVSKRAKKKRSGARSM